MRVGGNLDRWAKSMQGLTGKALQKQVTEFYKVTYGEGYRDGHEDGYSKGRGEALDEMERNEYDV